MITDVRKTLPGVAYHSEETYALDKERPRPATNRVVNVLAGISVLASVASVALSTVSPYPKYVREQELRYED